MRSIYCAKLIVDSHMLYPLGLVIFKIAINSDLIVGKYPISSSQARLHLEYLGYLGHASDVSIASICDGTSDVRYSRRMSSYEKNYSETMMKSVWAA